MLCFMMLQGPKARHDARSKPCMWMQGAHTTYSSGSALQWQMGVASCLLLLAAWQVQQSHVWFLVVDANCRTGLGLAIATHCASGFNLSEKLAEMLFRARPIFR